MDLGRFERRLQNLIEVQLVQLLPGIKLEDVLMQKMAIAIGNNIRQDDAGARAPNVISISLNPRMAADWQNPKLQSMLLNALITVTQEMGLVFISPPTLTISYDDTLTLQDALIKASHREKTMAETQGTQQHPEEDNTIPDNAFLIIEGVKVYPLTVPVVNIGRRLDNQLVIDDPRVSRNHAQLRALKGRYVLFDLNSTGGTFVNGQKANQSVLYPGDVISLAGVALIFGQDNPPPRPDLVDTSPLTSASTDRPTAILRDMSTAKLVKKDKKDGQ